MTEHEPRDPYDPIDGHGDDGLFEELVSAALAGDMPHPVDWSAQSGAQRRDELQRLWPWVVELAKVWPLSRDVLPPCWYRHESLIRVLSAARDAYLTAFEPSQAASAAADWMHVWDATEERLRRWVARTGCRSEHHADRIQRWVADEDVAAVAAAEFERFLVDDLQRHAADADEQ
jgi:hypothetical protein